MRPPLTAFYDGRCTACTALMRRWHARDRRGAIRWLDLHAEPDALARYGIAPERARAELHVVDADGRIATGVDAIAALWSQWPWGRPWAWCVSLPLVRQAARAAYRCFAAHRPMRRS